MTTTSSVPSFDFAGIETPSNYQEKALCVLLLDISGSMMNEGRLDALNEGLREFYEDIKDNSNLSDALEITLVAFDHQIHTLVAPSLVEGFEMPVLDSRGGATNIAGAIEEGINIIDARKDYYRHHGISYKRPWMILMTDGVSTNSESEINKATQLVHQGMDANRFHFFPIGIKLQESQMGELKQIAHPNVPPAKLDGLRFSDFFLWLSNSMEKVSTSREGDKISLEKPTWMQGFSA